jgi:hypothetical protein
MAPILKFTLEQLKYSPNLPGVGYYHIRGENLYRYTASLARTQGLGYDEGISKSLRKLMIGLSSKDLYNYARKHNRW